MTGGLLNHTLSNTGGRCNSNSQHNTSLMQDETAVNRTTLPAAHAQSAIAVSLDLGAPSDDQRLAYFIACALSAVSKSLTNTAETTDHDPAGIHRPSLPQSLPPIIATKGVPGVVW